MSLLTESSKLKRYVSYWMTYPKGVLQARVLRDHLICLRPRPRLVLIYDFFQYQYQDMSWCFIWAETNTKTCLDSYSILRPIPRLILIFVSIQDQYQESCCLRINSNTNTNTNTNDLTALSPSYRTAAVRVRVWG